MDQRSACHCPVCHFPIHSNGTVIHVLAARARCGTLLVRAVAVVTRVLSATPGPLSQSVLQLGSPEQPRPNSLAHCDTASASCDRGGHNWQALQGFSKGAPLIREVFLRVIPRGRGKSLDSSVPGTRVPGYSGSDRSGHTIIVGTRVTPVGIRSQL
eukprot:3169352-Rhodomonas_salina.1